MLKKLLHKLGLKRYKVRFCIENMKATDRAGEWDVDGYLEMDWHGSWEVCRFGNAIHFSCPAGRAEITEAWKWYRIK